MIIIEKDNTTIFYIKFMNHLQQKFGIELNKKFRTIYGIIRDKNLVISNIKFENISRYKNIYILLNLTEDNEEMDKLKLEFNISDLDIAYCKSLLLLISNGKLIEKTRITDEKINITFNFFHVSSLDNYGLNEFQNRYNYIINLLYNDNIEILENRNMNMDINLDLFKYNIEYSSDHLGDIPELFKKLTN